LFERGGTLLAQTFDRVRLENSGEPVALATSVRSSLPLYSVSRSGTLAFMPSGFTDPAQLTWFGRRGQPLRFIAARADYQHIALAPDEDRVAAEVIDPQTGLTDIWLVDTVRTISSRFTTTHGPEEMPTWAADGDRIAFASHRNDLLGLFVKRA